MPIGFVRAAVVLGLLSAAGPIAIDMYLPALPTMAEDLGSTPAGAQASLMAYFVALAVFQPVYGPLSDMIGRRRPLYFGLALYVLAGLGCAFAPNMTVLVVLRFFQGLGGCACMVIPRAVVRDLYTGVRAARLMSLIMLVFSIGPLLAPFLGSVITVWLSWRGVFIAMAVLGIASMVLLTTALMETRSKELRLASSFGSAVQSYLTLLRDRYFLGIALINACGISGFFVFIAGSPFVYIDHFGLSPTAYSIAFSLNAVGFFTMSQFNARIGYRVGLRKMVRYAVIYYGVVMTAVAAYFLAGGDSLYVLMAGFFLAFAGLGLVVPSGTVLALENYGAIAGTASSFLGTIQFAFGVVSIGLVGAFGEGGSPVPMVLIVTGFAIVASVTAHYVLRGGEPARL